MNRLICLFCLLSLALQPGCEGDDATSTGAAGQRLDGGLDAQLQADAAPSDMSMADAAVPDAAIEATCNGMALLCDRRYDQVTYPSVHNAMASREDGFRPPNVIYAVPRQLEDGARAFLLDIYERDGEILLCHGDCGLGQTPLAETLAVMKTWLAAHPSEVLTIIFESYVEPQQTAAVFEAAGLLDQLWAQSLDDDWPTLQEMIDADRRLVVFTDNRGGPAWLHYVWDHMYETHFHYESAEELSCDGNRGQPSNALFQLNHFLTAPFALEQYAEEINVNPLFIDRARECIQVHGRRPNFLNVDFYSIGDLFEVTRTLNEMALE